MCASSAEREEFTPNEAGAGILATVVMQKSVATVEKYNQKNQKEVNDVKEGTNDSGTA